MAFLPLVLWMTTMRHHARLSVTQVVRRLVVVRENPPDRFEQRLFCVCTLLYFLRFFLNGCPCSSACLRLLSYPSVRHARCAYIAAGSSGEIAAILVCAGCVFILCIFLWGYDPCLECTTTAVAVPDNDNIYAFVFCSTLWIPVFVCICCVVMDKAWVLADAAATRSTNKNLLGVIL